MIPTKPRRLKTLKLSKNLERQYIQSKCRDCTVVVTRMDFAKILGKFTKVKIQFETNNTPKTKQSGAITSRLKGNENGTLSTHKSANNAHPARRPGRPRKIKNDEEASPPRTPNILKESNRIKKIPEKTNNDYKISKTKNGTGKYYRIIFSDPAVIKADIKSEVTLDSLLPDISNKILPSEKWCIDYFPKRGEPKDDKIYDRIAAELEDLMYNEKTKIVENKESKSDEFPSILDILNDTSKEVSDKTSQSSSNLESSDVEAMLLGEPKQTPMDVDKPNTTSDTTDSNIISSALDDNPKSPSILVEPDPTEVPVLSLADKPLVISPKKQSSVSTQQRDVNENTNTKDKNPKGVTQVIFKKSTNGTSSKTVICPKNLKYSVLIQGKSIELLGAPKAIYSLEDLQVLLQIVEESELSSMYLMQ